jgi:hypothetical protein
MHQESEGVVGLKIQAHFVALKMYLEYCLFGAGAQYEGQAAKRPACRASSKEPAMYRLLMGPSNAVCDAMRITDEGERGMIRTLVNMMLLSLAGVVGFVVMMGAG